LKYIFAAVIFSIINFNTFSQTLLLSDYIPATGISLKSLDDNYKINIRGISQSLFESRKMNYDSKSIVNDKIYNRFRARRVRLKISGNQKKSAFSYRIQLNLAESEVEEDNSSNIIWDAWIGYNISKYYRLSFGQKSSPTDNIELLMASNTLQLPERSRITAAFANIREIGLFIDGRNNITGKKIVFKPSFNITTGDGYGFSSLSRNYGGLKYGTRINILPLGLFRNFGQFRQGDLVRELNPKLLIGAYASYNSGISSRRGRSGGDWLFYDVDSNYIKGPDYFKYGFDLLFKYRGFSLIAEYVCSEVLNISQNISLRNDYYGNNNLTQSWGSFDENGVFSQYSPNQYIRKQLILGSGLNIQAGYIFKNLFSVDCRFSLLNPDEFSFLNSTLFYNRNRYYEIGISKYFTKHHSFKIQVSYRFIDDALIRHPTNYSNNFREGIDGSEGIFYLMVQLAF